jgi:hypothetical protein
MYAQSDSKVSRSRFDIYQRTNSLCQIEEANQQLDAVQTNLVSGASAPGPLASEKEKERGRIDGRI